MKVVARLLGDLVTEMRRTAETADVDAVRNYMMKHPAANSANATLIFSSADSRMEISATASRTKQAATFALTEQAWPLAMAFLNKYTENDPSKVVYIPPHSHAGHGPS